MNREELIRVSSYDFNLKYHSMAQPLILKSCNLFIKVLSNHNIIIIGEELPKSNKNDQYIALLYKKLLNNSHIDANKANEVSFAYSDQNIDQIHQSSIQQNSISSVAIKPNLGEPTVVSCKFDDFDRNDLIFSFPEYVKFDDVHKARPD